MSQSFTDNVFQTSQVVSLNLTSANNNFAALKSAFSGADAPANTVAGMWWFHTATNILKLRNEANNGWQDVWDFANSKPVITNLSNEITGGMISSTIKNPATGTYGLRTLGTTSTSACAGNDSRLIGNGRIDQAALKTSIQSQSYDIVYGGTYRFTLTGGEYCFQSTYKGETSEISMGGCTMNLPTSYVTKIALSNSSSTAYRLAYVLHRYITSSGEVNWLFILRDKNTKKIIGRSFAPDHPCFGNGGKPLVVPHPFGNYDETKYEIIVINPSNAEIDRMEKMTIVEDESLPDKDILEVITENYEIDEGSNPPWPNKAVTVSLPKYVTDKKTKKKVLADYRFMSPGTKVTPVKKVIPKPDYIKVKSLKRRK